MKQPEPVQDDSRDALLADLVEELTECLDRGAQVRIQEYTARYPQLASQLQDAFDALVLLRAPQSRGAIVRDMPAESMELEGTLGDFRILRQIGRGGMGIVYESEQISLCRRVALKTLPFAAVLDPRQLQRFRNEALAAASLKHPNIVQVYSVGCERGVHYYAMEYVEGQTLAEVVRQMRGGAQEDRIGKSGGGNAPTASVGAGPSAETDRDPQAQQSTCPSPRSVEFYRTVVNWGIQAAEALEHSHQMGVVHRDIKPSNLMVDEHGRLLVADFGLAQTQAGVQLTITGDVVGTLRYMSPEQAQGNRRVLDHRTDVYSLGVTLYELLTLRTPFSAIDRHELIHQILDGIFRPPRAVCSNLPRELETIVLKAMAPEPEMRYPTARELADDLQRFLEDRPIRARPSTLAERSARFARRHRSFVTLAVVAILIVALASTAGAVLIARAYRGERGARQLADKQRQLAEQQEALAKAQKELAQQQRDEAEANLYAAHISLASHDWEQAQITRLHLMLGSHLPRPGHPDFRGWEWYYELARCQEGQRTLRGHVEEVFAVAWSPDGRRLASGGACGQLLIWDRDTGRVIRALRGHRMEVQAVAWRPDGRRLASSGCDRVIRIWDPESGGLVGQLRGHAADDVRSLTWSPAGDRIASCGGGPRIRVWDVAASKQIHSIEAAGGAIQVAWSPKEELFAAGHEASCVILWNAKNGNEVRRLSNPGPAGRIAWSPDGQFIASGNCFGDVLVRDAATGKGLSRMRQRSDISSLCWSPDSKRLASAGVDQRIVLWDPATGKELRVLQGHLGRSTCISWSPDGACLASAGDDRTVRLWDLNLSNAEAGFGGQGVREIAWSPDGGSLAIQAGKLTKVYDAIRRKELFAVAEALQGIAWAPAGDRIAVRRGGRGVAIWDTKRQAEIRRFDSTEGIEGPLEGGKPLDWSPDGRLLAVAEGKDIGLYDPSTGQSQRTLRGHSESPWLVRWSPDGSRLASGAWDGTVRIWEPASGQALVTRRGHGPWIAGLAWSPDSRSVATCGPNHVIQVWNAATGEPGLQLQGHTGHLWSVAWSPDGRRIASAGADGTVKIWCAATGRDLLPLVQPEPIADLAWTRDGRRLAVAAEKRGVRIYDASAGYDYADGPGLKTDLARHASVTAFCRADSFHNAGQFGRAIAAFTEVIDLAPELSPAYSRRGQIRLAQGDDGGLADCDEAIRLRPDDGEAWSARAIAYLAKKDFARAIADLKNAVARQPESPDDWALLCLAQKAAGRQDDCRNTCYEMFRRFDPTEDPEEAELLAWTWALGPAAEGSRVKAIGLANQAMAAKPKEESCRMTYAAVLYRADQMEKAAGVLAPLEGQAGGDQNRQVVARRTLAGLLLAMVQHRMGKQEQAQALLREAGRRCDKLLHELPSGTLPNARIALELLQREAQQLLSTNSRSR